MWGELESESEEESEEGKLIMNYQFYFRKIKFGVLGPLKIRHSPGGGN